MRSFPKLRPCLWDGLVAILVAALAVACAMAVWFQSAEGGELTAVVTVDGQEVQRCLLADFPEGEQVYSANGYTLRVCLTDGPGLRVAESDCPTQDCVHTGTITRTGQSIVCLPARIIIRLEGGTAPKDAPDVVIG